jgi:hypothetical protein
MMEIEQENTIILPPKPVEDESPKGPRLSRPVKDDTPKSEPIYAPKERTKKAPVKKAKQATQPIDEQAKQQLHLVMTAAVGGLCVLLISDTEYIPQTQELDAILPPLENILLRRVHMSGALSPDFNDLVVLLFGLAAYGARIRTLRVNRKSTQPRANRNQGATIQGNARAEDSSIRPFPGVGESWDAIDGLEVASSNS